MKKYLYMSMLTYSLLNAYEIDDFSSLSLEQLMDVQVTSASRREESQHLAPGIVSVITSKEMQKYGARHLRDVLDRVVGIQVLGSHQDSHSKISMRGVNSSHHEGHVLLLLNDRPVRQATDGGLNSDFYLGFPINMIDHIEIIRGPGSVMYGSNAVAGVINIVTKDGDDFINESRVDLGVGSYNRQQVQVTTLVGDADYSLNIGLNYIASDGDPINMIDSDGNQGSYESGEKSRNLVIDARYKNLSISAMVMDTQLESANSAFQFPSTEIDLTRYFLDLGYLQDITSGWDISLHYTMNRDSADWQINEAAGQNRSEARSDMIESILRGKVTDDLSLLVGANYIRNESGFERGLPKDTIRSSISAYVQLDYMISDKQKIIAGLQWNEPKGLSSDISYRAGYIHGFGDNTWMKLLYSEAYRSPTMVETSLDAPQLKGNPNLDPETVSTYDLQITRQTKNAYLALSLYHSRLKNLIIRVPGTVTSHDNAGYVDFNGVEFEGKYEVNEDLSFMANISYQENETDDNVDQTTFAPEFMAKVGFAYDSIEGVSFSAFNSYVGDSTDLGEVTGDPSININHEADAYNLLTANIVMDMGLLTGLEKSNKAYLSVYLDNLLDEDIYSADLNFANANNTIPAHWGRGIYGTFTYKF